MNWLYYSLVFGVLGWCLEIIFTGFYSAIIERNPRAIGTTYLYMFPIYAIAGSGFQIFRHLLVLASMPLIVRIFIYLILIYLIEYSSGWLLKKLIGRCPWQYPDSKWSLNGFVRFDYAPFWFLLCFIIEPTMSLLGKMFCG